MPGHCSPSSDPTAVPVVPVDDGNVFVIEPADLADAEGIIVWLHGASDVAVKVPYLIEDTVILGAHYDDLTWANTMAADGWINVQVNCPGDFLDPAGIARYADDIAADPGHGTRVVNTVLLWWDHVVEYLKQRYGATLASKLLLRGGSWGGWHTFQIVKGRPSGIIGWITVVALCDYAKLTNLTFGTDWTSFDSSGAAVGATHLNGSTIHGLMYTNTGDGTTDGVVSVSDQVALKTAAIAAGVPVTYSAHAGTHLTPVVNSVLTSYVTGTIDPLR